MTNKLIYGVIGNNWGNKIFDILNLKKKKVYKIKTITPFNNKKEEYSKYLKNIIYQKKINIIWLAINPYKNSYLVNLLINNNVNLIVEKPWLNNDKETQKIINILKKKKLKLFLHFEFIFLNMFKNLNKQNIKKIDFKFKTKLIKKTKIPLKYEFKSHLAAIKIHHFNFIKNVSYKFGYNKSHNERRITISYNSKKKILDFSNNKEDIIGKFINFVELSINKKKENYLDLNFAKKVNEELKKNNFP